MILAMALEFDADLSEWRDRFWVDLPARALRAAEYRGLSPSEFVEQAVELSIFEAEMDMEGDLDWERRRLIGGLRAVLDKVMQRPVG